MSANILQANDERVTLHIQYIRRVLLSSYILPRMNRPTSWRKCCPMCNGKGYIEEHIEKITDSLTGEEEIPHFLKEKINSQRCVRKSPVSYSGYSDEVSQKAAGCSTGGNNATVSLKERKKNEKDERKSTISSSGDNGMNLEDIIRRMSEEDFSKKENENNEGEFSRTINDSGYSDEVSQKAAGCSTGGNKATVSLKERKKNEKDERKSTISSSGDNGMNLEDIIRRMSEEDFSKKENENNEGEFSRTINDSGYSDEVSQKAAGCSTGGNKATVSLKERKKNKKDERKSTIFSSGDNGMNLEDIIRRMSEEDFSKKEIENNEGEFSRTINDSGYSDEVSQKAAGCSTGGNKATVSLKERKKNKKDERKSTIFSSGDNGMNLEDIIRRMSEEDFSKKENENNEGEFSRTINDSEESLQRPRLLKQHQPEQVVKNVQPVKRSATNQNMIQHGNVTTDRPTARPGVVSRKSALSTTEKPRSTAVPVRSEQKGSSSAVTHSAGVKKGVFSDIRKTMMLAMTKLKSTKWDTVMGGMQDISQILRCKPALVEEHLTLIYIFLSSVVLNRSLKLARAACQMAKDIFETVQCTSKHGLHDLVSSLLQRTSQHNKLVGQDAAEALDSMVLNTPPYYAVKALVSHRLRDKSNSFRATASRLLTLVITTSGADTVLGPEAPRVFKHLVISSAASFLEDRDIDARSHAQELFKFLMREYENCELVFKEEIEENLWKRISKKIVSMRAEINKRSHHSSRK